jgi:hypothetical protein
VTTLAEEKSLIVMAVIAVGGAAIANRERLEREFAGFGRPS